jgi:hypothetical protein
VTTRTTARCARDYDLYTRFCRFWRPDHRTIEFWSLSRTLGASRKKACLSCVFSSVFFLRPPLNKDARQAIRHTHKESHAVLLTSSVYRSTLIQLSRRESSDAHTHRHRARLVFACLARAPRSPSWPWIEGERDHLSRLTRRSNVTGGPRVAVCCCTRDGAWRGESEREKSEGRGARTHARSITLSPLSNSASTVGRLGARVRLIRLLLPTRRRHALGVTTSSIVRARPISHAPHARTGLLGGARWGGHHRRRRWRRRARRETRHVHSRRCSFV